MHEPLKNCPFCGGDARHDAHADDCYFILHRKFKNSGADMSPALEVLAAWNRRVAPAAMIGEPVFAFRRKGLNDFCTCTEERYAELSARPSLFETRIFYTTPQPTQAQAGAVPQYRLLHSGVDRIEDDDEFLSDDTTTWAIDQNGIFSGNIYGGHVLRPARRRIKGGQHGADN